MINIRKHSFLFFSGKALLLSKIKTIWSGVFENHGSVLTREDNVTSRSRLKYVGNNQKRELEV